SNLIGGTTSAARNIISGNDQYGVLLDGSATQSNTIRGNWIGLDANGAALGNSGDGISIQGGAHDNTIGGTAAGAGNVISGNTGNGVTLTGSTAIGNTLRGNSIHDNGNLGIDLGGDGVTFNDSGDTDTGPDNLQNFPVLTGATTPSGTTVITGALNST